MMSIKENKEKCGKCSYRYICLTGYYKISIYKLKRAEKRNVN